MTDKFGTPLFVQTPIWNDLTRVIPHTLQLVIVAEFLALLIGVLIGVYSAIRQYSVFDYTATMASFLGFAMPVFWLAADAADPLHRHLPEMERPYLLHLGAQLGRPNTCTFCVDRHAAPRDSR